MERDGGMQSQKQGAPAFSADKTRARVPLIQMPLSPTNGSGPPAPEIAFQEPVMVSHARATADVFTVSSSTRRLNTRGLNTRGLTGQRRRMATRTLHSPAPSGRLAFNARVRS